MPNSIRVDPETMQEETREALERTLAYVQWALTQGVGTRDDVLALADVRRGLTYLLRPAQRVEVRLTRGTYQRLTGNDIWADEPEQYTEGKERQ